MHHALVTGATGFIGRHLVVELRKSGTKVTCLVRRKSNRRELKLLGVEFVVGDVQDPSAFAESIAEVDVIFHLAAVLRAPWRPNFNEINGTGVGHLARACANARNPPILIFVSSLAAAGVQSNNFARVELDTPVPVSRYGRAKLTGEYSAAACADRVPISIVRPCMVYGEGDTIALDLFKLAKKGFCLVPSKFRVSLIHVQDLVEMLIRVAIDGERLLPSQNDADPISDGVYFAASPETPTFPELGQQLAISVGRTSVRCLPIPSPITWGISLAGECWGRLVDKPTIFNLDKAREVRAGSWVCSAQKAMDELDWQPTCLSTRLAQTAFWYQEQGWLN